MPAAILPPEQWWGSWRLEESRAVRWRIGPRCLVAARRPDEWRLASSCGPEIGEAEAPATLEIEPDLPESELTYEGEVWRFAARTFDGALQLGPALPDRPVVSRLETPLRLLPREDVTIHVSTMVWARVTVDSGQRLLLEIPIQEHPKDTWFGSSTRTGELCFSSRTRARLALTSLPVLPYRAITEVHLRNRASSILLVERLALPVPQLALFADSNHRLRTESVLLERAESESQAEVRFGNGIDPSWERLAPPRSIEHRNRIVRALSALVG